MTFTFIPGPSGEGLSDEEFLASALRQPLSMASTFFDQSEGSAMGSYGLGTTLREAELPSAQQSPGQSFSDIAKGVLSPAFYGYRALRGLKSLMQPTTDPALTEDQYKASPYYREAIPYDPGMTEARAHALADAYDTSQVRAFYAQKRPVTAFLGNLTGQALDPVNYIPVGGPLVRAAAIARFGRVAGEAVTASADAMANTAIFGIGSADERRSFGDDVTWQSTVSQIAMAGLIGAGFGAIHGRFGGDPAARQDIEESLSTLKNVQMARVALNDAIDGMLHNGEVRLSEASKGMIDDFGARGLPGPVVDRLAREIDPDAFRRLDEINIARPDSEEAIAAINAERAQIGERIGQARETARNQYAQDRSLLSAEANRREAQLVRSPDDLVGLMDYRPEPARQLPANEPHNLGQDAPVLFQKADAKLAIKLLTGDALMQRVPRVKRTGESYPPIDIERGQRELRWTDTLERANEIGPAKGATIVIDPGGVHGVLTNVHQNGGEYVSRRGVDRHKVIGVLVQGETDGALASLLERKVSAGEWASREFRGGMLYYPVLQKRNGMSYPVRPGLTDMSVPAEPFNPELAAAAKRVGKADTFESFRVDPDTGDFPEMSDIEAMRQSGRLTPEDEAALSEAEDTFKQANGYGEALKAFAKCEI
jgi:hypothetical protein